MSDESARLAIKTQFYSGKKKNLVVEVEVVVENNNSGPLRMCGSVTFPTTFKSLGVLAFGLNWREHALKLQLGSLSRGIKTIQGMILIYLNSSVSHKGKLINERGWWKC